MPFLAIPSMESNNRIFQPTSQRCRDKLTGQLRAIVVILTTGTRLWGATVGQKLHL